ncbi:MAG: hypothetical protein LUE11_11305 [Clostridia bacterium]|nr:hypothetical protein [Clostridia bacterium]
MKIISEVFVCPSTGWGAFLVYDEEECELYARVCDEDEWDPEYADEEVLPDFEATEIWCEQFGYRRCDSYTEAMQTADLFHTTF